MNYKLPFWMGVLLLCNLLSLNSFAQSVGINDDDSNPNTNAILDIKSTTKGFLIPRMTTSQRSTFSASLGTGDAAMLVYDTDESQFYYWSGAAWTAISASAIKVIQDADGDTKIQVEESADEDIIRFDLGGSEYFRMEAGRVKISNTGNSLIIGEDAGLSDDFSSRKNTFLGAYAGGYSTGSENLAAGYLAMRGSSGNTTGSYNVVLGSQAGSNMTSASANVFIGQSSGLNTSTGGNNIGIGRASLNGNTTGTDNIVLGTYALRSTNTGSNNIALGSFSLKDNASGDSNIGIGQYALEKNTAGYGNIGLGSNALRLTTGNNSIALGVGAGRNTGSGGVFIGNAAGENETGDNKLYIDNSNTTTPLIYGDFSSNILKIHGSLSVGDAFTFPITDGTNGQFLTTDGSGQLSWSTVSIPTNTSIQDTDGDTKIQVEESADDDAIRFDVRGWEVMTIDATRQIGINTTDISKTLTMDGDFRILQSNRTTGTDGNNLAVLGTEIRTMDFTYSGGNGIATIGKIASKNYNTGGSGWYSDPNRYDAGLSFFTAKDSILSESLTITHEGKVGIGNDAPSYTFDVTGDARFTNALTLGNYTFPTTDGTNGQVLSTDGAGNVNWASLTDSDNQKVDKFLLSGTSLFLSLENDGTGDHVVDFGLMLNNLTTLNDADNDTKIQIEESTDEDIIRFDLAGSEEFVFQEGRISILSNNLSLGNSAGNSLSTGIDNINLGNFAGTAISSGSSNIALGKYSLLSNTSGSKNIAIGQSAMNSSQTGNNNVIIGDNAGYAVTGGNNVFIGTNAGYHNTGSGSIYIGYNAGVGQTGSNQLFIDNSSTGSPLIQGDFSSDHVKINGTFESKSLYVHSNSNVGIGVTSPSKGKLEVSGTANSQTFSGFAYLTTASGAGTSPGNFTDNYSIYADDRIAGASFIAFSDKRIKNIQGITDGKSDLNTLMDIEITNYTLIDTISKGDKAYKKVIAQQVKEVYPLAVNDNTTEVVPDIYKTATAQKDGWIQLATNLKVGDQVQIIYPTEKKVLTVIETTAKAFKVASDFEGTVFVFGRQVNDFHAVDYEAISMLNVSATQELYKQFIRMQKENENLKTQLNELKHLKNRLAKIEALLAQPNANTPATLPATTDQK